MLESNRSYEHARNAMRRDHLMPVVSDTPRSAFVRARWSDWSVLAMVALVVIVMVML